MNDELYSLDLCARKAGVSLSTIKRDIVEGKLRATRIRRRLMIHPEDWGSYIQACRSVNMAADGKSGFSMPASDLAGLLRIVETLPNLSAERGTVSKIIALDARRHTRSRKRSTAG